MMNDLYNNTIMSPWVARQLPKMDQEKQALPENLCSHSLLVGSVFLILSSCVCSLCLLCCLFFFNLLVTCLFSSIYITLRCFYHVLVSPDFPIDNKDYDRHVGVIAFPRNVLFGDVRKHFKCKNTAEPKIIH